MKRWLISHGKMNRTASIALHGMCDGCAPGTHRMSYARIAPACRGLKVFANRVVQGPAFPMLGGRCFAHSRGWAWAFTLHLWSNGNFFVPLSLNCWKGSMPAPFVPSAVLLQSQRFRELVDLPSHRLFHQPPVLDGTDSFPMLPPRM